MTKPPASRLMRTCEHVGQGHPDKACDQFADTILDAILDAARASGGKSNSDLNFASNQRTAIEMLAKDHWLVISGEVSMGPLVAAAIDVDALIRRKWRDIGYDDADKVTIVNHLRPQSPELTTNANTGGAGDQGIMVGFATNGTKSLMPREYELARDLCLSLEELRASGELPWLKCDTKTQVTLNAAGGVERVVIAAQHAAEVEGKTEPETIRAVMTAHLMERAVKPLMGALETSRLTVNGSGSFIKGGPIGDAGVVGRKIVVDAYGPTVPVGGGAYSGKDPTKVDRSAAYMCRYIAKTAASMRIKGATDVTVSLAYGIGLHQPEMVTAVTDEGVDISDWVKMRFPDLSPRAIADTLDLWRIKTGSAWRYQDTAAYGHYGRDMFPWEQIAQVSD
ncbi:MAG: methionine adenosyltransferase domain-containing protein [Hyphomonadaceae bacterium]